jgi:3-hydroxyacyl-CoA dehydrogenase/enoyl-CoA hydratase/3-hydroxybutyryl-CoA epimerase
MSSVETRRQILFNRRESGVALLLLDCGSKLNYLGSSVTRELDEAMRVIAADPTIKAIVMLSAKPDNFVIGADLYEIRKATSYDDIYNLSTNGHATLDTVAASTKPVVMAINGPCLGGGLELALSGHWRIATDDTNTQFAFPETRLGLIPGLGGTQRTPRLVGVKAAIGMILSAESMLPKEALEIGLVDEIVHSSALMEAAEKRALELAADPTPLKKRDESFSDLDEAKMTKLFAMTERSIRIKTRGHYPAQTKAIEVVKIGLQQGMEAGKKAESTAFAELATGEVSANLIALFFATDFARQSAVSLAAKFDEANTTRIGIIGGGMMGTSIANLASSHGLSVKVLVSPGKEAETMERMQVRERVVCTSDWKDLADSEFVLEAVAEEVDAKRDVMRQIEAVVSAECTLASNTSSLPLDAIADSLKKSDRFVGVHFFHPVDRMPLVEIIALKTTARKSMARAADFVTKLEKIPGMVKNGPGFLINRLLTCYMMEAAKAADESVPINWLEEAAISFGMPIGPFELLDEVGEDVAFNVVDSLHQALGERFRPPRLMHDFRNLGGKGKRYGQGVYIWDEYGKRKEFSPDLDKIPYLVLSPDKCPEPERQRLAERIIFPMVDEAARCLEEKVVTKPREIDMAIIHGIGFPPFRGGLLKYADQYGLDKVAARLREIYAGTSRTVAPLIEKYLAEGRTFYSSKVGGKEDE